MVEIPEHLLKRSRDARSNTGDEEADASPADAAAAPAAGSADAAAAPAAGSADAAAAPAAAAPAPAAAPHEVTLDEAKALLGPSIDLDGVGEDPYPQEDLAPVAGGISEVTNSRAPRWLLAAFLILPIIAVVYIGQFSNGVRCGQAGKLDMNSDGQMVDCEGAALPSPGGGGAAKGPDGKALYATNCASCHGATGQGGVGKALSKENATTLLADFPDAAQQADFVSKGNAAFPDGWGANKSPARGSMPAFGKLLSTEEIDAIVKFERSLAGG